MLSGTVGVGKTTMALEVVDALAEREVACAAVDLDALVMQWPPTSKWNNDLLFENLAAIWPNFVRHGVTHLILARVLEDASDLEHYRKAVPGADIRICRLVAPERQRKQRLRARMPPGPSLDWHLHRTTELEEVLAAAKYEHFTVDNGDRPIREVAVEILRRAGWTNGE